MGDLRLLTVVDRIQSRTRPFEKLKVHTRDSQEFEFDEVVLTAPLGWLKRHQEAFQPPLPENIRHAIESMGYGCLEKVSIEPSARLVPRD